MPSVSGVSDGVLEHHIPQGDVGVVSGKHVWNAIVASRVEACPIASHSYFDGFCAQPLEFPGTPSGTYSVLGPILRL